MCEHGKFLNECKRVREKKYQKKRKLKSKYIFRLWAFVAQENLFKRFIILIIAKHFK